jgi:hypothetical protein
MPSFICTFSKRILFTLCLVTLFIYGQVRAENSKTEILDESITPEITIKAKTPKKPISEKRDHGETKEIKVNTEQGSYTLKPNTPKGSAIRGDGQSDETRPPLWPVLEFNAPNTSQQENTNIPQPPANK